MYLGSSGAKSLISNVSASAGVHWTPRVLDGATPALYAIEVCLVRCFSALHAAIRLHPALPLLIYSNQNSIHVDTFILKCRPSALEYVLLAYIAHNLASR